MTRGKRKKAGANKKRLALQARLQRQALTRQNLWESALEAAQFGPTPGWVTVRLWASVYDYRKPAYKKVPGWSFAFQLRTINELIELADVEAAAIGLWEKGCWDGRQRRFCCPGCKMVL